MGRVTTDANRRSFQAPSAWKGMLAASNSRDT
jgi:hypothetical protein